MQFIYSYLFVFIVNTSAFAQTSKSQREELGFQFIRDSASNFIRLGYLKLKPTEYLDSQFMYSDTTCIFYYSYSDSVNRKMNCYNNYDNYVYTGLGKNLSNQFLKYKRNIDYNNSTKRWDLQNFIRNDKLLDYFDTIHMKYEPVSSWINIPLFTKNRALMIVEFGEVCENLCSYGITILSQFKNGRWIRKKVLREWVS